MKLLIAAVSALLLINSCKSAPQNVDPQHLDDLIGSVFGPPNTGNNKNTGASQKNPPPNIDDQITAVFGNNGNNNNNNNKNNKNNKNDNGGVSIPNRVGCECVPYYQCANHTIVDNGIGLIDIRLSGPSDTTPRQCDNYLDVCCQPPDRLSSGQYVTPKPSVSHVCGQHNPEGVGFRITGDSNNEAQFGEFPWMVAILKEDAVGDTGKLVNVYQCGGALIHPSVVLTAAHCVNGKAASLLKVRAGEWDTQTKNEIYPHQDRQVANLVVHELYQSGSLHNDYALLRLDEPVELAENVNVVCLPDEGVKFDHARCFASGWGKDIFGKEGHYQVILKKVELPVVPHDACQATLRTTRLGSYFKLDRSFICAGGEQGKDTCKGDGGSPLVCPIPGERDRFYQAGMVAWGIGCGENQVPGVYANVAYAKRWIDDQMGYWGFDSREYTFLP